MMSLNYYENTLIKNSSLPQDWQSQASLDELLAFLQSNWEERAIFYQDEKVNSRQSFLEFVGSKGIRTKDYVGTISFKGHQLNIFPKVFKLEKEDTDRTSLDLNHLMLNLVHWIEYSTKMDYPYISISADMENTDNLQDLFISLYVRYVKSALERGLYFRYEEKVEDLSSIKGKFDARDYLTKKYANGTLDKFQCSYSTFEFDNLLNQIIKATLKYILPTTNLRNQKIIRNLLIKLGEVSDKKCTPSDCGKVQLSPMQKHYKIILSMSKMFLLNKITNYSMDTQDSFCFLFPTDLLFEGFVGGYLQNVLSDDVTVRLQASEVQLIDSITLGARQFKQAFTMRHDILIETPNKGVYILDTKYKEITRFEGNDDFRSDLMQEVASGDLYQVLSYAVSRGLDKVYLLYPQFRFEDIEPYPAIMNKNIRVENKDYTIQIYAVRIPFVFEENDDKTSENLKRVLLSLFVN